MFGLLLLAFLLPVTVIAAETEISPSVGLRQEYTDNLFTSSSERVETFITHITPGIKVARRTELLSGSLAARLNSMHYTVNSDMNKVDQVYEGNGAYRFTPLLAFSGSGSYREESWPDREIDSNGQALSTSTRRQNYGARAEYRLSELTAGVFDYGYEQIAYGDNNDFSDVTTNSVSVGIVHDAGWLLPLLKLRGATRYSKSDYEMSQIDNYELTVGGSRKFNELWSVSADAGGRYTRTGMQPSPADPLTNSDARSDTGWIFKASLDYGDETVKGSLGYSHDLSNSSGRYGSAVDRDIVTLSVWKRFSYELSALLSAGYYRSTSITEQTGDLITAETSMRGSFSFRYEFNRTVAADFGYEYFQVEDASPDTTASRNKLFIQLTAWTNLLE